MPLKEAFSINNIYAVIIANVTGNDCIVFYVKKQSSGSQIYYVCLNKTYRK